MCMWRTSTQEIWVVILEEKKSDYFPWNKKWIFLQEINDNQSESFNNLVKIMGNRYSIILNLMEYYEYTPTTSFCVKLNE